MSLAIVLSALRIPNNSLSVMAWQQTEDLRAEKVARFRRYLAGDHDNRDTPEMRHLLNQRGSRADSPAFNDNHCAVIIDTPLDRLRLQGVKSGKNKTTSNPRRSGSVSTPPATSSTTQSDPIDEWISGLFERNRLDGLQVDVHEATLCDGNSYVMIYPDEDGTRKTNPNYGKARFSHEPAYDGSFGMIPMYETTASETPMFAVKIWRITTTEIADTVRVNVYYPDRIERYIGQTQTGLRVFTEDGDESKIGWITPEGRKLDYPVIPWVMPDGSPIGVPVVHFRNRGSSIDNFGLSELENVVPLQDALNSTMSSMVATTLLSGFPIRLAVGVAVPAAVVPGLVLNAAVTAVNGVMPQLTDEQLNYLKSIRLDQFEVADLAPFITQATWLKEEMFAVTNTPTDDAVSKNSSGEARKQSEVKLLGKVKRFQTRNGNAWENAVRLAARVEMAYTGSAQTLDTLSAEWDDADLRNDSQFVTDMLAQYTAGVIDQKTYLESVQDIYDWDATKIDEIIQRTEKAKNAAQDQINSQDVANVHAKLLAAQSGGTDPAANGGTMPVSVNGNGANVNGNAA